MSAVEKRGARECSSPEGKRDIFQSRLLPATMRPDQMYIGYVPSTNQPAAIFL